MGDVDELHDTFPVVDRHTIKQIYELIDDPSPLRVAEVLEEAAEIGKVPDRDYRQMAVDRGDVELVEIDLDDPLDEPPDADPASPRNAARGEEAKRWAEENAIDKMARKLAETGDVDELLDFIATVDRWGNEALLDPNSSGLPNRFEVAINRAVAGVEDALLELADDRDRAGLEAARESVAGVSNRELADGLTTQIDGLLSLIDADGTEIEAARSYVLNEDLTPIEMAMRADNAHLRFDITVEQYQDLIEDANALLEEAREAVEASEA